jgi:LuxR family maltose regulon positive regulatory protein
VIAALQSVLEEVGETSRALLRSVDPPPIEVILTPLLNEIATQPERILLVLDDYHLLITQEIHSGITYLIEHLPPQFHLVISTRADPPLPIVRMRARGQLTELRGDDLRFNDDETRIFLNRHMRLDLTEADLRAIDTRIEGWIAGLQLAAISIRDQLDRHEFIVSFAGSPYYALEYLSDEVLNHLPIDVIHFLAQTSILTQLCASLCDRVTDRRDSAMMLARLYRENLFVTALDYEHSWYRYHHLFADLLRGRLQQLLDRQSIAYLHQRASHWYEENGYFQFAVMHAQEAGDMERIADLAEQAARASLLDSWMTNLLAWLETLPENVLRSRLRLRIYQACAFFFDGQNTECMNILEESKKAIQELPSSLENNSMREELSRLIEIVYALMNGLTLSLQGKLDQSSQIILQAKHLAEEVGNIFLLAHAYEGLALNLYNQGQLWSAASTSRQLIELAEGGFRETRPGQPLPIATAGYLLQANICLDQNKLEEMAQFLAKAFELCRMSGGAKSLVETYVMQSRLQQAQGDLDDAYQSITQAERVYHLKASMLTRFRLESQKARLNLEAGRLEDVIHWVIGLERARAEAESALHLPTIFHEVVQLILARVYLAKGEPENALLVLEHIQTPAEAEGRCKHVIEIYTLKSLALQALKRSQEALEHVEQALRLAEGEDFKRVFLDCAFFEKGVPIQQLLYKAAESGVVPGFTGKLLVAFPLIATDKQEHGKDLVEPLSKRELEVLECLARGLTNHEIAQELIISLDTVKTHTGNIYSKLGVNSRTQAVIKAKALGLVN